MEASLVLSIWTARGSDCRNETAENFWRANYNGFYNYKKGDPIDLQKGHA